MLISAHILSRICLCMFVFVIKQIVTLGCLEDIEKSEMGERQCVFVKRQKGITICLYALGNRQ